MMSQPWVEHSRQREEPIQSSKAGVIGMCVCERVGEVQSCWSIFRKVLSKRLAS